MALRGYIPNKLGTKKTTIAVTVALLAFLVSIGVILSGEEELTKQELKTLLEETGYVLKNPESSDCLNAEIMFPIDDLYAICMSEENYNVKKEERKQKIRDKNADKDEFKRQIFLMEHDEDYRNDAEEILIDEFNDCEIDGYDNGCVDPDNVALHYYVLERFYNTLENPVEMIFGPGEWTNEEKIAKLHESLLNN